MATTRPAVIIVSASFSKPDFYRPLAEQLEQTYGYETYVATLQSPARTWPAQPATHLEDVAYIRAMIETLAAQGKEIVLFGHSYGGIPMTMSIHGLSREDRKKEGKTGGVIRLVYLTCPIPKPGESLAGMMSQGKEAFTYAEGEYLHLHVEKAAPVVFSDLSEETALEMTRMMPPQSVASFNGPISYPDFKDIALAWIFCEQDKLCTPESQRESIANIEKESGKTVSVFPINSGHCPNVSQPEAFLEHLHKAIQS